VQISYQSHDTISQYLHVRLEMQSTCADGFSIKIVAENGADLSLIKSFSVNISDFSKFTSEVDTHTFQKLPSVYIPGPPVIAQFQIDHERNDGLCSPTSCTMLTSYLTAKKINPIEFAKHSYDKGLDKYGSWPFNMAHAFELSDGNLFTAVTRSNSFKNIHDQLRKGIPVVVSVRGELKGASRIFRNGHLMMVVGFDAQKKQVLCHDPGVNEHHEVKKRYDLDSFLQAWEKSHRLTYFVERKYLPYRKESNDKKNNIS
jgi:hypothetical protein